MPPESSCGYWRARRSGYEMPTRRNASTARSAASFFETRRCCEHRLGDLVADPEDRVEARHRLLEDHRHLEAAQLADLVLRELQQVPALEEDLTARDLGGRDVQQPHDRQRRHGLAAARFAHHPERAAPPDGEADAVDGLDRAVHDVEPRPQVAHVEQMARRGRLASRPARWRWRSSSGHSRVRGSRASRSPSPMKLIARTVRAMAMPGNSAHHQLPRRQGVLGIGERVAPRHLRRADAEVEIRDERFEDDGRSHQQGHRDDDRPDGVGQDVAEGDPVPTHAHRSCSVDEVRFPKGQERGAHESRDERPAQEAEDEDDRPDLALAEELRCHEDDEQERDGEEDVHDAHEEVVDLAAPEAGDRAHDDADEARDDHAPEAHREGDARSMDRHREHVATVAVGAEDVLRARGSPPIRVAPGNSIAWKGRMKGPTIATSTIPPRMTTPTSARR